MVTCCIKLSRARFSITKLPIHPIYQICLPHPPWPRLGFQRSYSIQPQISDLKITPNCVKLGSNRVKSAVFILMAVQCVGFVLGLAKAKSQRPRAALNLPFLRLKINHEKEQCPPKLMEHSLRSPAMCALRGSSFRVMHATEPGVSARTANIPALNNRRTLSKRCAFLFGSFCLQSVQVLRHSHRPCCLGNAGVLIHCDDCDPMSSRRQRESFEQLIVQYLCSLGAVNPQLQPLDSER